MMKKTFMSVFVLAAPHVVEAAMAKSSDRLKGLNTKNKRLRGGLVAGALLATTQAVSAADCVENPMCHALSLDYAALLAGGTWSHTCLAGGHADATTRCFYGDGSADAVKDQFMAALTAAQSDVPAACKALCNNENWGIDAKGDCKFYAFSAKTSQCFFFKECGGLVNADTDTALKKHWFGDGEADDLKVFTTEGTAATGNDNACCNDGSTMTTWKGYASSGSGTLDTATCGTVGDLSKKKTTSGAISARRAGGVVVAAAAAAGATLVGASTFLG